MLGIGDFAQLGRVSPRTLRHYDEVGLLRPRHVDATTGYRRYGLDQLGRLHRIVALRDLGLSIEQIGAVIDDGLPVEQLRGMLRLRRAQIEQTLSDERDRLHRVEAHLRVLEGGPMELRDVVIKTAEPIRVAEATAESPGFGSDNLGPVFAELYPVVLGHLGAAGVRPGLCVAWYDGPADDGTVTVHGGFEIGAAALPPHARVRVTDLPAVEVAAVVHRGPMDDIVTLYEAMARWIDDSGYERSGLSRELYHQWSEVEPAANVTEIQLPITRGPRAGPGPAE